MADTDDLRRLAEQARLKVFEACPPADVIVSTNPAHVGYLSGYRSILLDVDRSYRSAVVATREKAWLITGASDAAAALEVLQDPSLIYRYGEFYVESTQPDANYFAMPTASATFLDALKAAIDAIICPSHVVGIDTNNEWLAARVAQMLGTRRSFSARTHLLAARSIKLPGEIEKLRLASAITERGMEKALGQARAGMSELELSTMIAGEIIAGGGIPRFVVVTAGARSALVDAYATHNRLEQGDLLRLDIGCSLNGYWADFARTAVVGEPSRKQQARYDALLEGELAQFEAARIGISAASLFDVAVERVRQGALPGYRRTHCGHGIGLAAHEFPDLAPASRDVILEEGMVLCVETPFYELGWGGMMVEDTFVLTRQGPDYLTKSDRSLRIL